MAALALLVAGLYAAGYLVYAKLNVIFQAPGFASECNISSALNCDALMDKPESSLFGLPVSLLAIPTYLVMMFLAWRGRASDAAARGARTYLAGIGALAIVHSIYMASVSAKYGVFCPYCTLMYAVNLLVTAFAISAHGDGLMGTLKGALSHVTRAAAPMAQAAGVLVISFIAAWLVYGQVEGRIAFDARFARCEASDMFACAELVPMYRDGQGVPRGSEVQARAALKKACDLGMQQACVDRADLSCQEGEASGCVDLAAFHTKGFLVKVADAAELRRDATAAAAASQRACELGHQPSCAAKPPAAGATGAATTSKAPPKRAAQPPQAAAKAAAGSKPTPKLTENGWDYYEIPVGPRDHVFGPVNAPVTFVSFKDFECGFCRFVTNQEAQLKKKYKDKVRFVFKHYPMNADCNYRMGTSRMHEGACRAARASICMQEQGKFWDAHALLYNNQKKFSDAELKGYVEQLGGDVAAYESCYASERPMAKIKEDVQLAAKMKIQGTPRIYINNRLVTGSTAKDVLDYYIQMAMTNPIPPANVEAKVADAQTPRMVQMKTEKGPFWIDAFEAALDTQGRATSLPGVKPAMASWFDAKAACEKSGKRMCTEEEWVSACIGEPAVDDNKNGFFTDGAVRGRLYPYGAFYEGGACRDSEDKYTGAAGPTGASARCRTPEGAYDMSGNLYEWIGESEDKAAMIGGDWRSKTAATCRRRTKTYGPGIKNDTTGFRCCADSMVNDSIAASAVADTATPEIVGKGIPKDLVLETAAGGKLSAASFKGKVTYLTFFASWCGNCRKQMPAIKEWETAWASKGFQVVAINVDRQKAAGERYVSTLEPNFTIGYDPIARTMTDFDINAMPTSFIIDKKGVIKKRIVGYKADEIAQTKADIEALF
ncbi:MAG: redoxin family protein [Myxococcota bacterium]